MVKAIAAKAASGARYMMMRTTPKTAWVKSSSSSTTRWPRSPIWQSAKPNSTAMISTGMMSPLAISPTMLVGIIFIRKSMIVSDFAPVT